MESKIIQALLQRMADSNISLDKFAAHLWFTIPLTIAIVRLIKKLVVDKIKNFIFGN